MNLLKQEKGSITLFVVISMLFFVMFLTGMYMLSATAERGVIGEQARIKEIYEQGVNDIDNVYATLDNDSKKNLKDVMKVGDYVAYNPTAGVTDENLLTYTSPVGTGMSHGNGCSKTDDGIDLSKGQTFTANSNIKWRVLSLNKETGETVLISEQPIETDAGRDFCVRGAIGYLYVEQELNEICKIYGYGTGADTTKEFKYKTGDVVEELSEGTIKGSGARSINVKDINSITGYDPTEPMEYVHNFYYPTTLTANGKTTSPINRAYKHTYFSYESNDYISNTKDTIYEMIFGKKENANDEEWGHSYTLASRSIESENCWDGTAVAFCIDQVGSGNVSSDAIAVSQADKLTDWTGIYKIRPIVYLKSNIQTSGKDESGAWIIEE